MCSVVLDQKSGHQVAARHAHDLLVQVHLLRLEHVVRLAVAQAELVVEIEAPNVEGPVS